MSRIDDAVRRVLRLKYRLGLFENPYWNIEEYNKFGSSEFAQVAQKAAEESLVLLKNYKIFLGLIFAVGLVGCDSRIDAVNQQMAEIRNQPPLPIEPAPIFTPVPLFNYAAHQLKSPFMPSSLAAELKIMAGKRVYPNFNRQPQPLESLAWVS